MAETATTEEVEVETPLEENSGGQQDEFVARLSKIYQKLKRSKKLNVAMQEVEQELLDLLGVRLFTIWQSVEMAAISAQVLEAVIQTTMVRLRSKCHSVQPH